MACLYIKTQLKVKTPWSYEIDSWNDVTSVNFNSKTNVREDEIFGRQDIVQFFSEVSKDYKYLNSQTSE